MTFNEPTKPDWPKNVLVFHPTQSVDEIKALIKPTEDNMESFRNEEGLTEWTYKAGNHFSTKHYALLFAPGTYKDCDFEVGYYVQMAGLGRKPGDVMFVSDTGKRSGPFVEALRKSDIRYPKDGRFGLCLDTFWRSAENFFAMDCQWAVSQAAPLRNVHIQNELMLGEGAAYSSGGFLANAKVDGMLDYAANQQWYTRAADCPKGMRNGSWNIVLSGCTGKLPDEGRKGDLMVTMETDPKVRVEKPFISMKMKDGEEFYELIVPSSTTKNVSGPIIDGQYSGDSEVRAFNRVKVCRPKLHMTKDNDGNDAYYAEIPPQTYNNLTDEDENITKNIQDALDAGMDVVLCPGIFFLTHPLIVRKPDQVILGLGIATLVAPQDGSPCIRIESNVPGVRIAGLCLEASLQKPDAFDTGMKNADGVRSLIDVGVPGVKDDGDPSNPVLLADIFTRVGGSNLVRQGVETDAMVRIHSGNVVGDNLWLWRADHVRLEPRGYMGRKEEEKPNFEGLDYHQTRKNECMVKNAIVVNGNDVTMNGLFCEHTTEHQCVWNGERGTVNFFQCELPYDVDTDFENSNFVGYYVNPNVKVHKGRGIGVYSNFQIYDVHAPCGIMVPDVDGVNIENPFIKFLDNYGGIKNVIKIGDKLYGDAVSADNNKNNPVFYVP